MNTSLTHKYIIGYCTIVVWFLAHRTRHLCFCYVFETIIANTSDVKLDRSRVLDFMSSEFYSREYYDKYYNEDDERGETESFNSLRC